MGSVIFYNLCPNKHIFYLMSKNLNFFFLNLSYTTHHPSKQTQIYYSLYNTNLKDK